MIESLIAESSEGPKSHEEESGGIPDSQAARRSSPTVILINSFVCDSGDGQISALKMVWQPSQGAMIIGPSAPNSCQPEPFSSFNYFLKALHRKQSPWGSAAR